MRNTTRAKLKSQLSIANTHVETAFNSVSLVSAAFSERAFRAAVDGEPIEADTLDMQQGLTDMTTALQRIQEMLTVLTDNM